MNGSLIFFVKLSKMHEKKEPGKLFMRNIFINCDAFSRKIGLFFTGIAKE